MRYVRAGNSSANAGSDSRVGMASSPMRSLAYIGRKTRTS